MRPCLAGVPTGVCQLGLRLPISMLSRCQLQGDINFTIVLAPPHWAPLWSGLKVFVKTDSQVAVAILKQRLKLLPSDHELDSFPVLA